MKKIRVLRFLLTLSALGHDKNLVPTFPYDFHSDLELEECELEVTYTCMVIHPLYHAQMSACEPVKVHEQTYLTL